MYTQTGYFICQHNPSRFSANVITFNKVHIGQHSHIRTQCFFELLMVIEMVCGLCDVHFMRSDVYGAITFLCTY